MLRGTARSIGPPAKVMGNGAGKRVDTDLHRFKQFIETGIIATTEGQPTGEVPQAESE